MFGKCLICFVILLCAVTCYVKAGREAYSPEEFPCLNSGGICVQQGDCPRDRLEMRKGLCPSGPKQRSECCYGFPISATGCGDQAGECVSRSFSCATLIRADDCAEDQHCCVFVN